ncbi:MAG: HAD-IC family P-type ATPase, partial [Sphaerochaetaceae bacterium]|nr:HAD-IC family P-type ATPase [Sphaerochaetaceae bacterium]
SEGKTPLLFAKDKTLLGLIAVADTIKEDSTKAIAKLKDMGLKVVMLTGDNEITAKAIGSQVAIYDVYSNILPSGKADVINSLKNQGKVIMVGDGINDAPALTSADVGIAIGSGADIAIDAADVVLVKSSLNDVCKAISLSRETLKIIKQNLFWAFFYNAIGIPIAAGCFVGLGLTLSPMFGAAAMSLSSFCVVSNALRLNLFKMREAIPNKEIKMKTVNMKIEGMMCSHCEARVKKALEAIAGVQSAEVSHQKGSAIVTIDNTVSTEVLVKAVTDDGYNVLFAE